MSNPSNGDVGNHNEELEEQLNKVNEIRTLYNLHHDIWDETLMEPPFLFFYQRVLHPRERQVVDLKIRGLSIEEIGIEMGLAPHSIMRYIYSIRYIFRNRSRQRVNKFWNISRGQLNKNKAWGLR